MKEIVKYMIRFTMHSSRSSMKNKEEPAIDAIITSDVISAPLARETIDAETTMACLASTLMSNPLVYPPQILTLYLCFLHKHYTADTKLSV